MYRILVRKSSDEIERALSMLLASSLMHGLSDQHLSDLANNHLPAQSNVSDRASLFHRDPSRKCTSVPPYSLLAQLYLDGHSKPERRTVVYLDPMHPEFNQDGKIVLKHRWIQTVEGDQREHVWVFKERAIDTVLSRLDLNRAYDDAAKDEVTLAQAMYSADIRHEDEHSSSPKSQVGRIVVTFEKVTLGPIRVDSIHRTARQDSSDEDIEIAEVDKTVTHTAK